MSDFTKGKWKHIGDGVIIAEDGRQICSIFPRDREANTHLIKAAPKMREALLTALGAITALDNGKEWLKEIYAKIQQALAEADNESE